MKPPFLLSFFFLIAFVLNGQSSAVTSVGSLNIGKEIKPPILEIVAGSLKFIDFSGNNAIDAGETCRVEFLVRNNGLGDGYGCSVKVSLSGDISGVSIDNKTLPVIKVNETIKVVIPIVSAMNTVTGTVDIKLYVDEPNGLGTDPMMLSVNTRTFEAPMLQVTDYTLTGNTSGTLEKKKPFDLQLLLQNTQHGLAQDVQIKVELPPNVLPLEGEFERSIPVMTAGDKKSFVYSMIVNNNFEGNTIPIRVILSEKHGKFSQNKTIDLQLNQSFAGGKIVVDERKQERVDITIASLRSDVDREIPQTQLSFPNRFALIIGNEDYKSYQKDLNSESNVAFARNDANVFNEYCTKTLGVHPDNIILITDATGGRMSQAIAKITSLVSLKAETAELIFFYAGHGFPDEKTKESYIIPVDVSASNFTAGIKLQDLYRRLAQTNAKRITVFMDACFSGGGREAGLLAARGVKIKQTQPPLSGNLVVFSATKEDQTALPYTDKQHGMFTYYLLKNLQQNKGLVSYEQLDRYLVDQVSEQSIRVNNKDQNPETNVSYSLGESWKSWNLGNK